MLSNSTVINRIILIYPLFLLYTEIINLTSVVNVGGIFSVYVQILPRDINVCYEWPTSPGIHPLNISDEYPAPWGYYDTNGWLVRIYMCISPTSSSLSSST